MAALRIGGTATVETRIIEGAAAAAPIAGVPLALYVHVPWCVAKCPYCDFNSHVLKGAMPDERYLAAVRADLEYELERRPAAEPATSVFFGGGTPSLLMPETISRLLAGIRECLPLAATSEVTLEANPGTIERGRFAEYAAAGINRVSLGVQSFDDVLLARLGRIHSAREAVAAAEELHGAGVENFNLDLMYGLPGQDAAGALRDVEQALALFPAHVSYYELTLEPGTPFYRQPPPLPAESEAARIEARGRARLAAAGYARYEVSAFAIPDRRSRHNDNYWRYGDYIGLGPGAHGKRSGGAEIRRSARVASPTHWLRAAGTEAAIASDRRVAPEERSFEFLLNALRRVEGFSWAEFEARTGLERAPLAAALAAGPSADGLVELGAEGAKPTAFGLSRLNDILMPFLPA